MAATSACWSCQTIRRIDDLSLCTSCRGLNSEQVYYCYRHCSGQSHRAQDCPDKSHATCFEEHLPRAPSARTIHKAVEAVHPWCIAQITYSAEDYDEQQEYHRNDQRAEWFRIEQKGWTAGPEPVLKVSQRFDKIWRAAYPIGNAQYPSLVSFMGNTGVGKSTLVRAMMMVGVIESMRESASANDVTDPEWLNEDMVIECRAKGPVTRPSLADLASVATSVGVHLYHDSVIVKVPSTIGEQITENVSVLFADCEGFYGDRPTATGGATLQVPDARSGLLSRSGSSSSIAGSYRTSTTDNITEQEVQNRLRYKEIPIKAPSLRGRGKAGAELFYARYLYAFSDVVVFVTKSPQSLGSELGEFLTWIAKAERHLIPPRSPRTLVIVINKYDFHADQYYSESFLKDKMFDGLGNQKIWDCSDELSALKAEHDNEFIALADRITNNEKFFRLFFQNVRICYVPDKAKDAAKRQYEQYKVLRDMIMSGSKQSQVTRSERWSRYDVPTVSQLLDRAFWHFATRDAAFDWNAAAGKDNPTPISLSGHIAHLLRHTGTNKAQLLRFVDILAVCLIIYEYRETIHAREPDQNFQFELENQCLKGIEIYQSKFQTCAFKWHDGTLCRTRGFEHDDKQGHRHANNSMIGGNMDLSLFEASISDLVQCIRRRFVMMYEHLHADGQKPAFKTLQDFRRTVLGSEPQSNEHRSPSQTLPDFSVASAYFREARSNKTCFSCLQAAPDHFLPCGHGFCVDCVKDFGQPSPHARYVYQMQQCVLCGPSTCASHEDYEIRLDPRAGGVRLLTLDGGGIRGIIELSLLEKVLERINLELPIMELFDLIVGTSTGGIIALGVGTAASDGLTIKDISSLFMSLARQIFEKDRVWMISQPLKELGAKIGYGLLFVGILSSRYPSRPRREALRNFLSADKRLFGFAPVRGSLSRGTRVAVTASSGCFCTFANYSRNFCPSDQAVDRSHLGADRGFVREDFDANEPCAWEAAMATSAAPGYFVPWKIDNHSIPFESRREFTDGAVQANMPLKHALIEKDMIWPSDQGPKVLDISVSVGTGHSATQVSLPSWLRVGNVQEAIRAYHDNVLDSENVWQQFKRNREGFRYQEGVNYRLNVELANRVDLDDWKEMATLQRAVSAAYLDPSTGLSQLTDEIAFQLVGNLFFFEPERCVAQIGSKKEYIRGQIWTRLDCSKHLVASRSLLHRISGFYHLEGSDLEQMTRINGFQTADLGFGNSRRRWLEIQERMEAHPHLPFNLFYNLERTADISTEQSIFVELLPPVGSNQPSRRVRVSGFPISYGELLGITQKRRGVQEYPR